VQRAVREALISAAPVPAYGTHPTTSTQFSSGYGTGHAGDLAAWPEAWRQSRPHLNQLGFEVQRTLRPSGEHDSQQALANADEWSLLPAEDAAKIPPMRVVGQIQQMYIVAEGPDGLYLIDQHAAHERILYEKLLAQKEKAAVPRQRLLEPVVVELAPGQAAILEAELETLTEVGFEIEPFGGTTFRIRALPEILGQAEPGQALVDILAEMAEGAVPLARETHQKIAITVCKRASIKGGQVLSSEEMRELVRQLETTQAPRTCPHGRPTMIHVSAAQLAREFGRM
jgi:DNA mismatch repair protein MutL